MRKSCVRKFVDAPHSIAQTLQHCYGWGSTCLCFQFVVQTHLAFETCIAPWRNDISAMPAFSAHGHCHCVQRFVQTHLSFETCNAPWCEAHLVMSKPFFDFLFPTFCPHLTPPVLGKMFGNKSGMWMRALNCRLWVLRLPLHCRHSYLTLLPLNLLCLFERNRNEQNADLGGLRNFEALICGEIR